MSGSVATRQGTLAETLTDVAERLSAAGIEEAGVEAQWILAWVLHQGRQRLYGLSDMELEQGLRDRIARIVTRRVRREPLAYIMGEWEFYGLPFRLDPSVLIPRQETEILVETLLKKLEKNATSLPSLGLDLGTGSGNIAISLLVHLPRSHCLAVDVSAKALRMASINAVENGVYERFAVRKGDWFQALEASGSALFDWMVANPPYVAQAEWQGLQPEVKGHEPARALLGGPDGLMHYRAIAQGARRRLKPGGWLAMEIGAGQAEAVRALAGIDGLDLYPTVQDYCGRDRVVLVRRAS